MAELCKCSVSSVRDCARPGKVPTRKAAGDKNVCVCFTHTLTGTELGVCASLCLLCV